MENNYINAKLLPINPRYTNFEKINFKNLEFSNYSLINVAKELLKYEGDLKDFLELIRAIIENGFLHLNDKILVHLDYKKENYYILEGNRRMLAVKLINKEINFNDICGNFPYFNNTEVKEWEKNKKFIINILKTAKNIVIETDWFTDVSTYNNDLIWQTIYAKHVGEQIGKRDWSRAKYFDDLLRSYEKYLPLIGKEETVVKLSKIFGKKKTVIQRDIQSSIWIIKTINMYNIYHPDAPVDLRAMEVSGYELVLSQKLIIDGQEKTLRKILGLQIDIENLDIKWNDSISENQMNDIISFLIENALNKKITTRGFTEEIYEELGETIGFTLSNRRSLNFLYKKLYDKFKKNNLIDLLERKQFEALNNLKWEGINSNEFLDQDYDSKFVKSIKYTIRNDLKTLSNLKNFHENEYPFTNVANTIRNIIDLFILEFFYRIKNILNLFQKNFNVEKGDMQKLEEFIDNYDDSKMHNVNKVTSVIKNIVSSYGATTVSSFIVFLLKQEYGNRLKELNIDINKCENLILNILIFKKDDPNSINNFSLLNALTHKPYYGFENFNNINLIDNLNVMFNTIKDFIQVTKIWLKQKINIKNTKKEKEIVDSSHV